MNKCFLSKGVELLILSKLKPLSDVTGNKMTPKRCKIYEDDRGRSASCGITAPRSGRTSIEIDSNQPPADDRRLNSGVIPSHPISGNVIWMCNSRLGLRLGRGNSKPKIVSNVMAMLSTSAPRSPKYEFRGSIPLLLRDFSRKFPPRRSANRINFW